MSGRDRLPAQVRHRAEYPGGGEAGRPEVQAISEKSCGGLGELGPGIQWLEGYVTGDSICCVFIARGEAMVRRNARMGGFPANQVSRVRRMIDPASAEG